MYCYYDYNSEDDEFEIYFDEKPSVEIRDDLKLNGWRWNPKKKCWYNDSSDENEEYAMNICDDFSDDDSDNEIDDEVFNKLNNQENAEYFTQKEFDNLVDWRVGMSSGAVKNRILYITESGKGIFCDSKTEYKMWTYLEENELIIDGGGQNLCISYSTAFRKKAKYYPDIVVLTRDYRIAIIEVKATVNMSHHLY